MFTLLDYFDKLVKFVLRYSEFVFIKSSGDIFVSMGVYIRIYSHRYACLDSIMVSHLIYYKDFLQRLAVECLDPKLEGIEYFFVTLSYTCIYNLLSRKTASMRMQNFIPADTIGSKSFRTYRSLLSTFAFTA